MWRACKEAIPTKQNLMKRRILLEDKCEQCGVEAETVFHALWECAMLDDIWDVDNLASQILETCLYWFVRKGKILTSWPWWCGRYGIGKTKSEWAQMTFPKLRFSNKHLRPNYFPTEPILPWSTFSSYSIPAPCSMESTSSELSQTELWWGSFSGVGQGGSGSGSPWLSREGYSFTVIASSSTIFAGHSGSHGSSKGDVLRTRTWCFRVHAWRWFGNGYKFSSK